MGADAGNERDEISDLLHDIGNFGTTAVLINRPCLTRCVKHHGMAYREMTAQTQS